MVSEGPRKFCWLKNPDPEKWYDPEVMSSLESRYHPNAKYSMWSRITKETGDHGNQCTYGADLALLKKPPSSGTADFKSPSSGFFFWSHIQHDVNPFEAAIELDKKVVAGRLGELPDPPGDYMEMYFEVRPLVD